MTTEENDLEALIESFIDQTIKEGALRGFNIDQFRKLPSIKDRVDFARKFLPFMGKGSAREVYAISTGKVLKIAINKLGVAQNQTEYRVFKNPKTGPVVAKIFSTDVPQLKWIVSEIAKPFKTPEEFKAVTGVAYYEYEGLIDSFPEHDYQSAEDWFQDTIDYWKRVSATPDLAPENKVKIANKIKEYEALKGNKFLTGVINLKKQSLLPGDLVFGQMGVTADGRPIVIDYGFDLEVADLMFPPSI